MSTKLTYMVLTVFNQKALYDAYKKRTKNVEVDLEEYNKMKEADPEFYRDASSLQYGKVQFCCKIWCILVKFCSSLGAVIHKFHVLLFL